MGTRAKVEFKHEGSFIGDIYVYLDGYPDFIGRHIIRFLKEEKEPTIKKFIEYMNWKSGEHFEDWSHELYSEIAYEYRVDEVAGVFVTYATWLQDYVSAPECVLSMYYLDNLPSEEDYQNEAREKLEKLEETYDL